MTAATIHFKPEEVGHIHMHYLNVQYFTYILIYSNGEHLAVNFGIVTFIVTITIKILRVTRGYLLLVTNAKQTISRDT